MTQLPDGSFVLSDTGPATTAPKTSGLAIASVILSTIGIVPCFCVFFLSLLGIVFGAVALPVIRRGEARGRGLIKRPRLFTYRTQ